MKRLKLILLLFLSFFTFANCALAKEITFAQISDIHYSADNLDMKKYLYFLKLSLAKENPNFAVFLGDNVDKSNEKDIINFMNDISSIETPYYITLGNHDAYTVSGVDKQRYVDIVQAFNKNQKYIKKPYYYFKPNKDIICVVLDVNSNFSPSKHGFMYDEQVEWVDKLIGENPNKLFIIFQHVPIVPPREEYDRSLLDSEKYAAVLKKHSNIILVSAGHYHEESVKKDENGVMHVCAPPFKYLPASYQIIKVIYGENQQKPQITVTNVKV